MCFNINDNLVLHSTVLVVPDFGNVKFLLSTNSMSELQTRIDITSKKIIMKKKCLIFKLTYFLKLKPNKSKTIQIESVLKDLCQKAYIMGTLLLKLLGHFLIIF